MRLKNHWILVILLSSSTIAFSQISVGVETGAVFTGYNDVRIPGDGGTFFSLSKELKGKAQPYFRATAEYTLKSRHHFILLFAPLETKYSGNISKDIYFVSTTFPANTHINATYKFNSYRLTYRYDIVKRPKFEFGLGLTAKIRDAKITLQGEDEEAAESNVGFVPIINFHLLWKFMPQWGLLFQGDALAAPQGRAEDALLALNYTPIKPLRLYLGYRMLEGGSDSKIYNFANFNYIAIGATYTFDLSPHK